MYQLEYQRTEDEIRWRVIEADLPIAYKAVRLTFLDLGLPIKRESFDDRTIIAENEAPLPLTLDEWKEVAKQETPKLREISSFLYFSDDPRKYIVTIKASLRTFEDRTLVLLDYTMPPN